ncbi:MAG: 6-carboxyhexanoate--CoA ligase [Kiritimatiellae bacterium]|nr:6-carboxyhexanoate--CoA ligase [Kiritimatiellia bacterium]
MSLFSLKMRASEGLSHVSGAERIVEESEVSTVAKAMVERALNHSKGKPDFINVKVEAVNAPRKLSALKVTTNEAKSPEEGWRIAADLLKSDGVEHIDKLLELFKSTYSMRGAMLVDADTLQRLEPDPMRGIRATYMDRESQGQGVGVERGVGVKDHYLEAIVLATKVANAPGIIAEICMSDDPDYVTGYVASKRLGYQRITSLKEKGDGAGGRIFLYRGPREEVAKTIEFLEKTPVLVTDVVGLGERVEGSVSLEDELRAIKDAGLWRETKVFENVVDLGSNDYLGLANDPRLKAAAIKAIEEEGAGAGAARLLTGTKRAHVRLEEHLARFKGTEAAITFATGYMANVGTISALVKPGDAVFSDELNHASIIDGCRLSKADIFVYRHNDMNDLKAKIKAAGPRRRKLAVSDAVFSMDGDVLDLPRFLEVCREGGAMSMIDEAHSTGVLGATGRGICEHFGSAHPDVMLGTLSKALGSEGGYVAGSKVLVDYLRNKARSFIFSTAYNPGSAAASDMALTILEEHPELVERLHEHMRRFNAQSAIVPIIIGDEARAMAKSKELLERGYYIPAIRYPTVAKGAARLRLSLSAKLNGKEFDDLKL